MKLSIVIPVYNTQNTLPRCIKSILGQTFSDYEIILVDDGSTDRSPQLCDEYARKDTHISVIHQKNGGLSDARNTGIAESKGEYLTFVDSDDAIAPQTLQSLMKELYQHPDVDILEYPVKERIGHHQKEKFLTFNACEYRDATEYWLAENTYQHTYAWNKIYRQTLFADIRFPKGKKFEDALTLPYLIGILSKPSHTKLPRNPVIRTTDKGQYLYYWNNTGITATATAEDLRQLYTGHCRVLEKIFEKAMADEVLLRKHQQAIEQYLTQILNISMDIYEMSGKAETNILFTKYVEWMHNKNLITTFKLKVLIKIGYHRLCKINQLIHKIRRHR